jgi:hypothetical protein
VTAACLAGHHPPVPPELETYLLVAALVAPIGVLIGMGTAAFLRMSGRRIPLWLVHVTAGLVGLSQSFALVAYATSPTWLLPTAVLAALGGWALLSRGRRIAFGIMLVATGLPAVVWWAVFLFREMSSAFGGDPVWWLWATPSLVVAIIGGGFVLSGDRAAPPPRLFPQPAGMPRDPMPIANALQRAHTVGPIPVPTLLVEAPALIVLTIAVPFAIRWGAPWPIVMLAAPLTYAWVVTELWYPALGRMRPLWEGMAVVGNPEIRRFREATGGPVPSSKRAMNAWLDHNPERPEIRGQRAELLATLGRLDEARGVASRMETGTDRARFEQHSMQAWIDWLAGGPLDVSALRDGAERVGAEASEDRTQARAMVAVLETRDLLAQGKAWTGPLTAVRQSYGAGAAKLLREDTYWPRFWRFFLLAMVVTGLLVLPGVGGS